MKSMQKDVRRQSKAVLFAGTALIGLMCFFVYSLATKNDTNTQSHIHDVGHGTQESVSGDSPYYNQVLKEHNSTEAGNAAKSGNSYLSVLEKPKFKDKKSEDEKSVTPPPQTIIIQQATPIDQRRHALLNEQKKEFIAALMAKWKHIPHGTARASDDSESYSNSISTVQHNQESSYNPENSIVIEDFARTYAVLETSLDTDENSVVTAFIPDGKYQGARLYAMGYKRLNSTIDLTFTAMEYRGNSYKVQAKPVDVLTNRTTLSGEVDNRYFSRIILPAITNGIGRVGELYERASQQNIITTGGNVIQTYPNTPNTRNVLGTMVGGAGAQAGRVLAADAAQLPEKQVTLESGATIGIQFIGRVTAADSLNKEETEAKLENASQAPNGQGSYPPIMNTSAPFTQNNGFFPSPQYQAVYGSVGNGR